ncbi:MAG TPA: pyrroloquinoline quinone biosynthesis peptide chaperone PqqD [Bryobacteraceae bacterium]|jgi:pyrroloquinoline quinone biosynthesis protein D|nr:pyrroloquinoline quinone biosynthesis peptide chaperone PqqD [Bryobacteraceae bacterium]
MTGLERRPLLKPGCRLSPAGDVLLIPEGVLRLQGPATRIVQSCDGSKTVAEIVATLLDQFPAADQARVSEETSAFLTKLAGRGAIEFV